jgi:hypothetical protein
MPEFICLVMLKENAEVLWRIRNAESISFMPHLILSYLTHFFNLFCQQQIM